MTMPSWRHYRMPRSSRLPASPTRSSLHPFSKGERVVDVGSGGGFATRSSPPTLSATAGPGVVGIDMTPVRCSRSRGPDRRPDGLSRMWSSGRVTAEKLPVEDGWADVVISNGVINLCADKRATFQEIYRVLRPRRPPAVRRHRERESRSRSGDAATSISGPLKSPVVCRVQPGKRCLKTSASWT